MTTSAIPSQAAPTGPDAGRKAQVERSAVEFESVFLSQMLRGMTVGLAGPGSLADAESNPFAGMLQDEYARLIARSGGVGIAGAVMRELLGTQDIAAAASP